MTSADPSPTSLPEPLPDSLRELASAVVEVQQRMAKEWEPIVQEHIASGCTDVEAMHRTLDWVLDCAGHPIQNNINQHGFVAVYPFRSRKRGEAAPVAISIALVAVSAINIV